MTEPNSEKRHHPRIPVNSRFLLHLKEEEYSGYVSNISIGGLLLGEIQPNLSQSCIGQQCALFFNKNDESKEIKCEIVHMEESGVGVMFLLEKKCS